MTTPNTDIPFIQSVYLQRRVWLDELAELTDAELKLLDTEVAGLKEEASNSVVRALEEGRDYGVMEKLVRVSGRFSYAIDREQTTRQRKESFLEITRQLSAVKAERDALRTQLDYLLAK